MGGEVAMRSGGIASEEIYDSIFDDEAFRHLPGRLAKAFDARSAVIGWHYGDGGMSMLGHSGYWSDKHVLDYVHTHVAIDPWTQAAIQDGRLNSTINMEELVSPSDFESSQFYNEFLRGIGDDTFRCIGVYAANKWGKGMVSVHRGRTQPSFDAEVVKRMDVSARDVRRMLSLRGKYAALERNLLSREAMLDAAAPPSMLLDATGRLLYANSRGEAILRRASPLFVKSGIVHAQSLADTKQLNVAVQDACRPLSPTASSLRMRWEAQDPIAVSVVPFNDPARGRTALLLFDSAAASGRDIEDLLVERFGLTAAEAAIACRLAEGVPPKAVAQERNTAEGTVRTQIKSIASKLGCSRQLEIVLAVRAVGPPGPRGVVS